eukprot:g20796.t1
MAQDGTESDVDFRRNERFAVFENAVSSSEGEEVTMRLGWHRVNNVLNEGANTMYDVHTSGMDGDAADIGGHLNCERKKTVTLDSALATLGLVPASNDEAIALSDKKFAPRHYISVLKMDCEGCEPAALLGAPLLFKHNAPKAIMIEVNADRYAAAGSSPYDVLKGLELRGYAVIDSTTSSLLSPLDESVVLEDVDYLCLLSSFGWNLNGVAIN